MKYIAEEECVTYLPFSDILDCKVIIWKTFSILCTLLVIQRCTAQILTKKTKKKQKRNRLEKIDKLDVEQFTIYFVCPNKVFF